MGLRLFVMIAVAASVFQTRLEAAPPKGDIVPGESVGPFHIGDTDEEAGRFGIDIASESLAGHGYETRQITLAGGDKAVIWARYTRTKPDGSLRVSCLMAETPNLTVAGVKVGDDESKIWKKFPNLRFARKSETAYFEGDEIYNDPDQGIGFYINATTKRISLIYVFKQVASP